VDAKDANQTLTFDSWFQSDKIKTLNEIIDMDCRYCCRTYVVLASNPTVTVTK
jgi:hypothetical protein